VVDEHAPEFFCTKTLPLQPWRKAVEQVTERHFRVELVWLFVGDRPSSVIEKAIVREHQPIEISHLRHRANQLRHLLIQLVGRIMHPRDADMVYLQVGIALANRLQLIETRLDETMSNDDLA